MIRQLTPYFGRRDLGTWKTKRNQLYQDVGSGCVPQNGNKNVWNRQKHDSYFQKQKVSNFKIIYLFVCVILS